MDGTRLFWCCSVTGQWAQSGTQKVTYKHEEELPYFESDTAVEQAAQEVVESPSLEILKAHLDATYHREPVGWELD